MKLIAVIQESPDPKHDFIIVRFNSDKTGQHFQVFVEGHFKKGRKQGDEVLLNIRFKSVVMKDLEREQCLRYTPVYRFYFGGDRHDEETVQMMYRAIKTGLRGFQNPRAQGRFG